MCDILSGRAGRSFDHQHLLSPLSVRPSPEHRGSLSVGGRGVAPVNGTEAPLQNQRALWLRAKEMSSSRQGYGEIVGILFFAEHDSPVSSGKPPRLKRQSGKIGGKCIQLHEIQRVQMDV